MTHTFSLCLDHNHDGRVSFEEFTSFLIGPSTRDGEVSANLIHYLWYSKLTVLNKSLAASDAESHEVAKLRNELRRESARANELKRSLLSLLRSPRWTVRSLAKYMWRRELKHKLMHNRRNAEYGKQISYTNFFHID